MFDILQYIKKDVITIPDDRVAILLSGGIDSVSVALLAERFYKKPICYTFRINGTDSDDSVRAKKIAEMYNWEFNLIDVPISNIEKDFVTLIEKYNCKKKTQLECAFPFLYVYPQIKENYVLTGLGADSHFGLSRKAAMQYVRKDRFHEFSRDAFAAENPAGRLQHLQLAKEYNKEYISPYFNEELRKYLATFSWSQLNYPRQKMPIRLAFEFDILKIEKVLKKKFEHKNLQLVADIPSYFEKYILTNKNINVTNRKNLLHLIKDYAKNKSSDITEIFV